MRVILPALVRRYSDRLAIAQTLWALDASSAAATADEAIDRLRQAVAHLLERIHPRQLVHLGRSPTLDHRRVELELGPGLGEAANPVRFEVDVVLRRYPDSLVEILAPQLDAGLWVRGDEAAIEQGLDRLARLFRARRQSPGLHRPSPDGVELRELTVEFEPFDLIHADADALWLPAFMDVEAQAGDRVETPTLCEVAQLWTVDDAEARRSRRLLPVFGRQQTVERLWKLIASPRPSPVVLVGPPRVGKTALARHLGWQTALDADDARRAPVDARLWFADPPRLTSADLMSGGWQEQAGELLDELEAAGDVLYLGRAVQALDAGKYVGSDYSLAQFLKTRLAERTLRLVAEATPAEWDRIEQHDVGFARQFDVLRIDDPPDDAAAAVVRQAVGRLAQIEAVTVTDEAVERAWHLQRRFATGASPVGRTIDFVERTIKKARLAYRERVEGRDVVEQFCAETGLPEVLLLDERKLELDDVVGQLTERVMGQPEAVEQVARVVGITKAGLAAADRPLGSFLFVGPTGVGKTELARALAELLFGDERRMVRLDMSEYGHPDAYARLIGEHGADGDLTGPIRRQPFSVVLLDEIEKAHPSVYDLLLQVLGEARLTDAEGQVTRFQNAIVIMTSNLGVEALRPSIGFGQTDSEQWAAHFRRAAERFFRPEFLARVDQFIPFRPLAAAVVADIARRELDRVRHRDGVRRRDLRVSFDEAVVAWVADRGFSEQYGARPIKRVVEQQVVWPLSRQLAQADAQARQAEREAPTAASASVAAGRIAWTLTGSHGSRAASERQAVLAQVEAIASLRRRLQRYMHGELFADLEWQIAQFEASSQQAEFWELPDAADIARRAEQWREIVEPAYAIAGELSGLEDLASEAYHARSFELADDIASRLDEIAPQVDRLFLEVLRTATDKPDEVTLLLPARDPQDPWRRRLVGWYRRLAGEQGWTTKMWRGRPQSSSQANSDGEGQRRGHWEHASKASGPVVALEVIGRGVRPLLADEGGLHRMIAEEGNAVCEVVVVEPGADWPRPQTLLHERPSRPDARVWNFRTGQVALGTGEAVGFDERDPWAELWPRVRERAWALAESDWW